MFGLGKFYSNNVGASFSKTKKKEKLLHKLKHVVKGFTGLITYNTPQKYRFTLIE